jgi:chromosome segregation ATPase
VDSGKEAALSSAMRPYMQTLVVKTKQDLQTVIDFADKQKIKDFSLFCLENIPKVDLGKPPNNALKPVIKSNTNAITTHFLNAVFEVESLQKSLDIGENSKGCEIFSPGIYIDIP